MRIRYTLGTEIIHLLTAIAEKKGEVKAYFLNQITPHSREKNRIDSVHATIHLQDKNLTREAAEDIIRYQSIRAPRERIREVTNTSRIYEKLSTYDPLSQKSFKLAYQDFLEEPDTRPEYRMETIPVYYWRGMVGMTVPCEEMKRGLKDLFHYLRFGEDKMVVKSCLCHYAIIFYQPFKKENEKMSRLWQTLLLMKEHPSLEFLPWEQEILNQKKKYYSRLPGPDQNTDATDFLIYMLEIINTALAGLLESCRKSIRPIDRIRYFYTLQHPIFTRKDYMLVHKNISMATASRDLDLGVESGFFDKHGSNNQTKYRCRLWCE